MVILGCVYYTDESYRSFFDFVYTNKYMDCFYFTKFIIAPNGHTTLFLNNLDTLRVNRDLPIFMSDKTPSKRELAVLSYPRIHAPKDPTKSEFYERYRQEHFRFAEELMRERLRGYELDIERRTKCQIAKLVYDDLTLSEADRLFNYALIFLFDTRTIYRLNIEPILLFHLTTKVILIYFLHYSGIILDWVNHFDLLFLYYCHGYYMNWSYDLFKHNDFASLTYLRGNDRFTDRHSISFTALLYWYLYAIFLFCFSREFDQLVGEEDFTDRGSAECEYEYGSINYPKYTNSFSEASYTNPYFLEAWDPITCIEYNDKIPSKRYPLKDCLGVIGFTADNDYAFRFKDVYRLRYLYMRKTTAFYEYLSLEKKIKLFDSFSKIFINNSFNDYEYFVYSYITRKNLFHNKIIAKSAIPRNLNYRIIKQKFKQKSLIEKFKLNLETKEKKPYKTNLLKTLYKKYIKQNINQQKKPTGCFMIVDGFKEKWFDGSKTIRYGQAIARQNFLIKQNRPFRMVHFDWLERRCKHKNRYQPILKNKILFGDMIGTEQLAFSSSSAEEEEDSFTEDPDWYEERFMYGSCLDEVTYKIPHEYIS